jgi:hypothetical protein
MAIPPERELQACLRVLTCSILSARIWGWQKEVPAEELADLMDAIHNIPELLLHWESCDQELLLAMLEDFERKWASSGGLALRSIYEQELNAKSDSPAFATGYHAEVKNVLSESPRKQTMN